MEAIRRILKIAQKSYDDIVFKHWFFYCEYYAIKVPSKSGSVETSLDDFQKLLANTQLFNYWYAQYQKYEREFIDEAQPYLNLRDPQSLKKLYEKNVWKVKYEYSKVLMAKARKMNLNPQLN